MNFYTQLKTVTQLWRGDDVTHAKAATTMPVMRWEGSVTPAPCPGPGGVIDPPVKKLKEWNIASVSITQSDIQKMSWQQERLKKKLISRCHYVVYIFDDHLFQWFGSMVQCSFV